MTELSGDKDGWEKLPHIILRKVLSYLAVKDVMNARSTCRHWRKCISGWEKLPHNIFRIVLSYLALSDVMNARSTCGHWRKCISGWEELPHPILRKVLSYLSLTDAFNAKDTCQHWHRCISGWEELPHHILRKVLSYLSLTDALNAKDTCQHWCQCKSGWEELPDDILMKVLSYLPVTDVLHAGATCWHWCNISKLKTNWKFVSFPFPLSALRWQNYFDKYGKHLIGVTVLVNQTKRDDTKNVISMLEHLCTLDDMHLLHFSGIFKHGIQDYDGHEFLTVFEKLLTKFGENEETSFKHLNLKGLQENLNSYYMAKISDSCPKLEYLNVVNTVSVLDFVSPDDILNLALECKKLHELHILHNSLSDGVLNVLTKKDREPLKILKLYCVGVMEEYDISSQAWKALHIANPNLKLKLKVYKMNPQDYISEIMNREMQLQELIITDINLEDFDIDIIRAVRHYSQSLEKLVVKSLPHDYVNATLRLQRSLFFVAQHCKKLRTLRVTCPIEKDIINEILKFCPSLTDYSLTYL